MVSRSKLGRLPIQLQVSVVCCTGSPRHEYEYAVPPTSWGEASIFGDVSSQHLWQGPMWNPVADTDSKTVQICSAPFLPRNPTGFSKEISRQTGGHLHGIEAPSIQTGKGFWFLWGFLDILQVNYLSRCWDSTFGSQKLAFQWFLVVIWIHKPRDFRTRSWNDTYIHWPGQHKLV